MFAGQFEAYPQYVASVQPSLILEKNTKMRKLPMPRIISYDVVSLTNSICE